MRTIATTLLFFTLSFAAFAENQKLNIQVLGDSIMAWNGLSGNTVARNLAKELDANVADRSRSGEVIGRGGNEGIFSQYRSGDWDWIVLNGGGNDFLRICKCATCDPILNRLISKDGRTGIIPNETKRLRARGHKVLFMGYLRTNGFRSPVGKCTKYVDALEDRVARFANQIDDVVFMSNKDLVPTGNRSFHAFDRIHPSIKGSRAIAKGLANVLMKSERSNSSVFSNGG